MHYYSSIYNGYFSLILSTTKVSGRSPVWVGWSKPVTFIHICAYKYELIIIIIKYTFHKLLHIAIDVHTIHNPFDTNSYINLKHITVCHTLYRPILLTWAWNISLGMGFVRGSASIRPVKICFRITSPCLTISRMKWYLMSICLVLPWYLGSLAYCNAAILSELI